MSRPDPGPTGAGARKTVRIGGASGFWGDSSVGAMQLARLGDVQYLVFDYLAELTMSILSGAQLKNPQAGYATDFVGVAMRSVLNEVATRGLRVVSNAGGINPLGCAKALSMLAAEMGLSLRVAVVLGDNVMPLLPQLRAEGVQEMQSGRSLPEKLLSANAYLGALPIKAALDGGAQVVITGRCVDSAVTLGVLMHEFGWSADQYGLLAAGSLAGHIIECGCQATGGLFTDWREVPDWPHIGYPVIECQSDGAFVVTKPPGTGGLVTPAVVAEQLLYEIGDPASYLLPDVVCDFRQVTMAQQGEHRVEVRGARGRAPTRHYKVSATYMDGFRCSAQLSIVGFEAAAKAQRTGEAILARTRELLQQRDWGDFSASRIEVLGAESAYGPHAQQLGLREAVLRVAVTHRNKEALELFAREIAPAGTSWSPGTTGSGGGRSGVAPSIRQFAFLLDKSRLELEVVQGETRSRVLVPAGQEAGAADETLPSAGAAGAFTTAGELVEVPLMRIAHGRSGDKGDTSNIGILARRPEWLGLIREQVTEATVAQWLAHLVRGPVRRFELPGVNALNFVCEQALDGGGMASLRNDPLGKGMAQILLAMPVRVPRAWLDQA
jgi:hypothetical protein